MKVSARVRVSGPLVSYVEGFTAALSAQGYTDRSIANQLGLVAHLSRWIDRRVIAPEQITAYVVERFIADRRRTHAALRSPRALEPLLAYLRSVGARVPAADPPPLSEDEILCAYDRYLAEERGVQAQRRRRCLAVASEFLRDRDVVGLALADVTEYVQAHVDQPCLSGRLSALRSVLRFLFLKGDTLTNLVYAVPSASHRRQVSLPKGLEKAEVDAMLATCDRRTTTGRRDYAALLLMVRLGLRAGEVAALDLDDIDWEAGEMVVHGKGGSIGRLPLPTDVGEAIVSYLRRRRRQGESRCLLLQSRAPYRDATAGMVKCIVRHALVDASISPGGAHRLRHTAATQMLRQGASLTEIAQVLRHRHIDTTAIYAKVDRDKLQDLAQPWPTGYAIEYDQLCMLAQPWPGGAA